MGVFDNKKVYLRRRSLRLKNIMLWTCTTAIAGTLAFIIFKGPEYTQTDRPNVSVI